MVKAFDLGVNFFIHCLDAVIQRKGYHINWQELMKEYRESGMDDLLDFATSYTFNWHEVNGEQDNLESKQNMHREIVEGLIIREGKSS